MYERSARGFARYLPSYVPEQGAQPTPKDVGDIDRDHIEPYITAMLTAGLKASANQQFRSLKTFFNWLVEEEEINRSPMRNMKPPEVGETEVPVIPDDALRKLLKSCSGRDFESRRDMAILMLFIDTGVRLSELTERQVKHIDLDLMVFHVLGKGDRQRAVPFGRQAAQAIDRYLRAYAKHIKRPLDPEGSDPLWIGIKSRRPFTISGVGAMVERRAAACGVPHIHPHQFRHTFAHQWKLNGGNEDALMRITGWRSREMLGRYGASAAVERARQEHRDLSPGDRLNG